jgi:hypothetical protein
VWLPDYLGARYMVDKYTINIDIRIVVCTCDEGYTYESLPDLAKYGISEYAFQQYKAQFRKEKDLNNGWCEVSHDIPDLSDDDVPPVEPTMKGGLHSGYSRTLCTPVYCRNEVCDLQNHQLNGYTVWMGRAKGHFCPHCNQQVY